jgi:glycosyltransferase involved in cell wall biosynthesis
MKVLFVLYENFLSNSAVHVHYLANHLVRLGVACYVAVPAPPLSAPGMDEQSYRVFRFDDQDSLGNVLQGPGRSIVHAWTPRENVRRYCETIRKLHRTTLVVHLEDNEDAILRRYVRRHSSSALARIKHALGVFPPTLSHPTMHKRFIATADAVSVVVEPLAEFVPNGVPWTLLTPGVDHHLFYPRGDSWTWRHKLDLPQDRFLLGYAGTVNWANSEEVGSVYRAAEAMTRRGRPTSVLRTGRNVAPFAWPGPSGGEEGRLELGHVAYSLLPEVYACADMLVQPGRADEFNRYRLPSKLPEYLAMGKPVILPRANVGELLSDGRDALVFHTVDEDSIAQAAERLTSDQELGSTLGAGAARFASRHFDWAVAGSSLLAFYQSLGN